MQMFSEVADVHIARVVSGIMTENRFIVFTRILFGKIRNEGMIRADAC